MVDEQFEENGGAGSPGSPGNDVGHGGIGGHGGHGGAGGVGRQGKRGEQGLPGISGEDTFMNQSLWLGWRRWTWVRLAFLLVVLASAYGFWHDAQIDARDDKQDRREEAEEVQEEINQNYQACLRGNDTRVVIREVVDLTEEGGTTDLTSIEGFDRLSPETQVFLINLRDTTAASEDSDFKEQAYALLTIRDCEEEYPGAEHA